LLPTAGDGVRIQAEEFTQNAVAAVSQLDGLQAGEQTTLLFVEQAVEKSCFQFLRRYLESGSIGDTSIELAHSPTAEGHVTASRQIG
jgi:hypothetical protein